ncbi:MAG TPA: hypothetical protein VL307_00670 [Chitinophagaceae bacterium]|nr:hypothetical protein [Chitinophagaceae bacterium]
MQFEEFSKSIDAAAPPASLNKYAAALWYDAKGDWEKAHTLVQDENSGTAAWIHAYLHRKEGDQGNAAYWYRLANRRMPTVSLEEEWKIITEAVL